MCLVIIPARGGSKGVPQKNLRLLHGKPLVQIAIETALAVPAVSEVVVSTDSEAIAEVAIRAGATVVARPPELSCDLASSESAVLHVLETLLSQRGEVLPDLICLYQCTSPLTSPEDLYGAIMQLLEGTCGSIVPVAPFHHFLWRQTPQGAEGVNHSVRPRLRRQEREAEFLETGAFYVFRRELFLETRSRFISPIGLYEMPKERVFEIDEIGDLEIAETLLGAFRAREVTGPARLLTEVKGIIFDFDGVFTDNKVHVDQSGIESVSCDRSDGLGIERLRNAGIPMIVISKETNPVVRARCEKLRLPCIQACDNKIAELLRWVGDNSLEPGQVAYLGNDINDLECLRIVGFPIAVSDAYPEVRSVASTVLRRAGGHGAVRELADRILADRLGGSSSGVG